MQLRINLTMHNSAPFTKRTLNFNVAITLWWESGVSYPPFLTPDVTCLFPRRFSPSQPVPYLLNPASVTALNAKALPRQMIKVSSQFTLQCIDLMFPNLPGLFLKLPRTFRIFYSIPFYPLPPLSFPLSLSLSCSLVCLRHLQLKIGMTEIFLWSCLHMNRVYIPPITKMDCLK